MSHPQAQECHRPVTAVWSGDPPTEQCAGALASRRFVKLPSWFTAANARRVMKAKGVEHALVEERGRIIGSVAWTKLGEAHGAEALASRLSATTASVAVEASPDEALAVMQAHDTDCLPVVAEPFLIGVVTRAALEAAASGGHLGGLVPPSRGASASTARVPTNGRSLG